MNRNDFLNHIEQRNRDRFQLLKDKGAAYSGMEDAFANFKRNAEKLGLTKYQIWAVYCGKHLDAIFNAIKSDPSNPVDKSEGLIGRIDDAINYLELLSGMREEDDKLRGNDSVDSSPVLGKWTDDSTTRRINRKAP